MLHSFAPLLTNTQKCTPIICKATLLFSLADELVYDFGAAFALDVAAPVELAVTTLYNLSFILVVASAAAHQLTSIHALRCLVAKAPHCAQGARAWVLQAVVWTGVHVHQIKFRGRVELAMQLRKLSTGVEFHGYSTVILLLQCISHLAEVSQLQPAGL